jgi:hypothetical protein
MEIKIVAEGLNFPLTHGTKSNPYLDNLKKRGFIGPSIFHLCQQKEESIEHLFNQCSICGEIWDQASQIMRKTNRERDNIIKTIENWGAMGLQ